MRSDRLFKSQDKIEEAFVQLDNTCIPKQAYIALAQTELECVHEKKVHALQAATYTCTHACAQSERGRDREGERDLCVCVCMCVYVCVYICICTHIHTKFYVYIHITTYEQTE